MCFICKLFVQTNACPENWVGVKCQETCPCGAHKSFLSGSVGYGLCTPNLNWRLSKGNCIKWEWGASTLPRSKISQAPHVTAGPLHQPKVGRKGACAGLLAGIIHNYGVVKHCELLYSFNRLILCHNFHSNVPFHLPLFMSGYLTLPWLRVTWLPCLLAKRNGSLV